MLSYKSTLFLAPQLMQFTTHYFDFKSKKKNYEKISSLFCNTSDRQERHERHERYRSETRATQVWHECYTNNTSAIQVKNFGFDIDTSENISSHLYISYMANKRLQGEKQFHSENYLLDMLMPCWYWLIWLDDLTCLIIISKNQNTVGGHG